jgi:DNA-binding NtrC family response regulator
MRKSPPVVALINSSDDLVELVRAVLERDGFVVMTAQPDDVRRGKIDVKAFIEQHQPVAVVYDLIPPFDRQWQFLNHLRQTPPFLGRAIILSSANGTAARELAGHNEHVFELLGRPSDLEAIVDAVRRAAADSASSDVSQ